MFFADVKGKVECSENEKQLIDNMPHFLNLEIDNTGKIHIYDRIEEFKLTDEQVKLFFSGEE